MKITIEDDGKETVRMLVKAAVEPKSLVRVLLLGTATAIADNLKDSIDRRDAVSRFGTVLESLVCGTTKAGVVSHVVQ